MKNVMVRAWEIAKAAVTRFGGKVKEYFAQALAMAWRETKAPVKRSVEFELKADTRKYRTWLAQITGPCQTYKMKRQFLNHDRNDEFGYKVFILENGVYEYNNGRRGFFQVDNGEIRDIEQSQVLVNVI
ncbi:hypothetical protein JCM10914A_55920 [Paenibacillus sp. JCM 10914]|uniref:hypothetical protein n=1 Tax=Paenibacillus sp. JCM 10914 TaxID=1236974 RepID=UPI00055BC8A4|nr:hypothetical protein [Paenibacillus sp. JCM 10914]